MCSDRIWDVVIIGAGLCGSVAAAELAKSGQSVLLLEKGHPPGPPPPGGGKLLRRIWRKLRNDMPTPPGRLKEEIAVTLSHHSKRRRQLRFPAYLGTGPGGSSLIYGAALGRFREDDFRRDMSGRPSQSEPNGGTDAEPKDRSEEGLDNSWPLDWAAFSEFYTRAETLMRVRGTPDPTDPETGGDASRLLPPPPVGSRDLGFAERLTANGRNPYRLHVGIDYKPGCTECLGRPCARRCKADGFSRALEPAMQAHDITLRSGANIDRIERIAGSDEIIIHGRDEAGSAIRETTRHVVMAAGALMTPIILGRSPTLWSEGRAPDMLGRGLMFHISDILAVFDPKNRLPAGPQKSLAFRDHYHVDGQPLGEVQSLGIPITAGTVAQYLIEEAKRLGLGWMRGGLEILRLPATIAARSFESASLFATIVEDLPLKRNRVQVGPDQENIEIEYHIPADLSARSRRLRDLTKAAFAPWRVRFLSAKDTPNWGHPCGTCRMGVDRATSVTTPDGQLWGCDQVTVVDASVFPSSGAANPSLTAIANTLRIVDGMTRGRP